MKEKKNRRSRDFSTYRPLGFALPSNSTVVLRPSWKTALRRNRTWCTSGGWLECTTWVRRYSSSQSSCCTFASRPTSLWTERECLLPIRDCWSPGIHTNNVVNLPPSVDDALTHCANILFIHTSHMILTEVDDIANSSLKSMILVPRRSLASSSDCCVMIVFVPPVFTMADSALGTLRPCEFSALTMNT